MPDDSYTLACDVNEEWALKAQNAWRKAGVEHKIDFKLAPAVDTLEHALQTGQGGSYDFVFIDADKENYDAYYELSLKLLKQGGVIAIDNTLLFGSVIDSSVLSEKLKSLLPEKCIQAVRDLNKKIHTDSRVDMSMLQIADGLTLIKKR